MNKRRRLWVKSKTIGQSFDPRRNAFNFLRLVFALLVIVSHSIPLGGFGNESIVGHATLGDISVDGFFAISGFLVARSAATSKNTGRYAWHRFLRIYPGIWVCLIVIAFVIAPLAFIHQNPGVGLGSYFRSSYGPFEYLADNFSATQVFAYSPHTILINSMSNIDGTPGNVPFPNSWAGSLWTVQWELLCYVLMATLAVVGALRHRFTVVALFVILWAVAWIDYLAPGALFRITFNWVVLLRMVPIFLLGALVYLFADWIPDSPVIMLLSVGLFIVGVRMNDPYGANVLYGPALVYLVLWLGIHLDITKFGQRHDLSFGVYIYGFAVQELLAVYGVYRWGYVPYAGLSIGVTLVLAALSWSLVESRALRLKRWSPHFALRRSRVLPVPDVVVDSRPFT